MRQEILVKECGISWCSLTYTWKPIILNFLQCLLRLLVEICLAMLIVQLEIKIVLVLESFFEIYEFCEIIVCLMCGIMSIFLSIAVTKKFDEEVGVVRCVIFLVEQCQ